VETDFWPGLLGFLQFRKIPAVLVNGRISEKSKEGYKRFRIFFRPLCQSFTHLFMQTRNDADFMEQLGIQKECIQTLGNLKFDIDINEKQLLPKEYYNIFPPDALIFIAGSTHPGEEKIIFHVFKTLQNRCPLLRLIVAPRNPERREEICSLAKSNGLDIECRTAVNNSTVNVFLLDTIGELINFYAISHIAFVGGSLVKSGGHNPIEPAGFGLPVLFGPDMSDFHEIAHSLVTAGGARQVADGTELQRALESFLVSERERKRYGTAARQCIVQQRGVINNHLKFLKTLL
jgi:3-deoxy-D-manno-octulosonic-acid transferase